jgi:hypothetical protein
MVPGKAGGAVDRALADSRIDDRADLVAPLRQRV